MKYTKISILVTYILARPSYPITRPKIYHIETDHSATPQYLRQLVTPPLMPRGNLSGLVCWLKAHSGSQSYGHDQIFVRRFATQTYRLLLNGSTVVCFVLKCFPDFQVGEMLDTQQMTQNIYNEGFMKARKSLANILQTTV